MQTNQVQILSDQINKHEADAFKQQAINHHQQQQEESNNKSKNRDNNNNNTTTTPPLSSSTTQPTPPINSLPVVVQPWHQLRKTWQADVSQVSQGIPQPHLTGQWNMLLLGDGSPTRNLGLLTQSSICVDLRAMADIGQSTDNAPPEAIELISAPRVRREVWLLNTKGEVLIYAVSWWSADEIQAHLRDSNVPIWNSLGKARTELHRQILGLYCGRNEEIEKRFGYVGKPAAGDAAGELGSEKEGLYARHYVFWHKTKPLTLIHEVFNPVTLGKYVGPVVARVCDSM